VARVEIVEYRERWAAEFAALAASLRAALGETALRIDHVGSTAVPGLAAKDVIDVQVAVASLEPGPLVEPLRGAWLEHVPEIARDHRPPWAAGPDEDWRKAYFRSTRQLRRAHVHVRKADAPNARYALLFRDYLRGHAHAAAAYGELKRRLADALGEEPGLAAYPDLKDPACDIVAAAAEDWAAATAWRPGPSDG
jgi:GrpB-like predicted nucleotidyltransferase (UPF0157 family)